MLSQASEYLVLLDMPEQLQQLIEHTKYQAHTLKDPANACVMYATGHVRCMHGRL